MAHIPEIGRIDLNSVVTYKPLCKMEVIRNRLQQLEAIETALYVERQATVNGRSIEDEHLLLNRQREDEEFFRALQVRDQEEDVSPYFELLNDTKAKRQGPGSTSTTADPEPR